MRISKKLLLLIPVFLILVLSSNSSNAQTWNSNAGGYNGGYGQVYGTWGLASATKNMDDFMRMTIQKTMMKAAMEKKWGKKAVAEVEAKNRNASRTTTAPQSPTAKPATVAAAPAPIVRNYAAFKPEPIDKTGDLFANSLGETAEQKTLLKQIYSATKIEFEKEAAKKGLKNNIAAALTFFIVVSSTVYHDAPEPSDEVTDTLYTAINQSIDEIPEFGQLPNSVKQEFYNKMIGFSGLILAGYMEGKQTNNAQTVKDYGQIAGALTQMILKTSPDNIRFTDNQIVMKN